MTRTSTSSSWPSLLLAVVLVLFAACAGDNAVPSPWQEPPVLQLDLRITVDPVEVGLLQPVRVTLDRFRKQGVEVSFVPNVPDKSFVTKDTSTSTERPYGDGFWQRTTMILLPIAGPGDLKIPSFRAETAVPEGEQPQIASTPEQVVKVTTTLTGEHGADIEAPGDPFPTPFAGWWWILGAALVLLVFVAVFVWMSRRAANNRLDAIAIAVPAHVKALRELQRWRAAPRITEAEIDAFYVGVSQVLRVYLEDRFGLHAPERTTEEFLHDLKGSAGLVREHDAVLKGFLTQCDMVKFAKVVPAEAEHDTTFQLAEAFIESTRADRAPDAADAASPPTVPKLPSAALPPELPASQSPPPLPRDSSEVSQ